MSDKPIDDGGPAFPTMEYVMMHKHPSGSGEVTNYKKESGGMSLRDHFAGLAMQGHIARMSTTEAFNDLNHEAVAHWAYVQADAMLRARKAEGSGE